MDMGRLQQGKTIVIGLGNPILGDDGVGWRIVEEVERRLSQTGQISEDRLPEIEFDCLAMGGLSLMERMSGYERAIVVDALATGRHPRGSVLQLSLEDLPDRAVGHLGSAHDTTLPNALQAGRAIGADLPEQVYIIAVETEPVYNFTEELSPPAATAVPIAAQAVVDLLTRLEAR